MKLTNLLIIAPNLTSYLLELQLIHFNILIPSTTIISLTCFLIVQHFEPIKHRGLNRLPIKVSFQLNGTMQSLNTPQAPLR